MFFDKQLVHLLQGLPSVTGFLGNHLPTAQTSIVGHLQYRKMHRDVFNALLDGLAYHLTAR